MDWHRSPQARFAPQRKVKHPRACHPRDPSQKRREIPHTLARFCEVSSELTAPPNLGNCAVLEIGAERELQVALAASDAAPLGGHFSKIRASRVKGHAAAAAPAPIRVVDEVERFSAELETCFLGNGERLEQPEVPVLVSGLVDKVANALCVESSGGRFGKN